MHLIFYPAILVYRHPTQIIMKQTIQIEHNKIRNPNGQEAAHYKHGRGFELGTTENKFSKWPDRESNPRSPDWESDTLNNRLRCFLISISNKVVSHFEK